MSLPFGEEWIEIIITLDYVNNLVVGSEDTIRVTERIISSINNVDSESKEIDDIIVLINSIFNQTNFNETHLLKQQEQTKPEKDLQW